MKISFHEWDNSAHARRTVAGLGWHEVQVWLATAPADQAGLTIPAGLLDPSERLRAGRYQVPAARWQFVFARAFLRQLLAVCCGVAPAALAFGTTPRGKPCLAPRSDPGDVRFNLSHSRSRVAIALTRGREVGVDVEWIDDLDNLPLLAARIFSPRELGEFCALGPARQRRAFFDGWTRKEAYLKATGEGATGAFAAVEVSLVPGQPPQLRALPEGPEAAHRWAIYDLPLAPDFAGAVVVQTDSSARHTHRDILSVRMPLRPRIEPA